MKILLDTHAFLWFIAGDSKLSDKAKASIEDYSNDKLVSMASMWEMAMNGSLFDTFLTDHHFPELVL